MYSNVNSFSEANFRSQAVALMARSRLHKSTQTRCIRLLPDLVTGDQYQAMRYLLHKQVRDYEFMAQFDRVFSVSIWQSLDAKLYCVLIDPFIESVRSLFR